ncbi:MAG: 3-oxoacyl-[acyl-carrier-protein] synthase III C-terminal domain-containing protein [Polyangiaceae bacterium]
MHRLSSVMPCLTGFKSVRPAHEAPQRDTIEWLAKMHTEAERTRSGRGDDFDAAAFCERMRKLFYRCGCSPEKISSRGYELADGTHAVWSEMRIYDVGAHPDGAGSHERTQLYARATELAIDRLYAEEDVAPRDLLHVTCTGYTSPSAAQRLVAKRGWGARTRVTHAYHMGCYASLPTVRIAGALVAGDSRVDIVHNELCTLHMHPADHSPEQLVVQSLFADGHIRYSVVASDVARAEGAGASLAVMALREEILPDSGDAMGWAVSDHGMRMTLARDVPIRIARAAREFVSALFSDVGLSFAEHAPSTIFAIHPGGPKVIDVMQEALSLSDAQVAASREVLFRYGNMSSATLPHIWMNLTRAPDVREGTRVVSLAFGPGLTVSAGLMVKT